MSEYVWKVCIKDLLSTMWCFWDSIRDKIKFKAVWKMLEGLMFQRQAMIAEWEGLAAVHCLSLMFVAEGRQKGRPSACLTNQTGSVVSHQAAGRKAACPTGWEPSLSLPSGLTHHLADVSPGEWCLSFCNTDIVAYSCLAAERKWQCCRTRL